MLTATDKGSATEQERYFHDVKPIKPTTPVLNDKPSTGWDKGVTVVVELRNRRRG